MPDSDHGLNYSEQLMRMINWPHNPAFLLNGHTLYEARLLGTSPLPDGNIDKSAIINVISEMHKNRKNGSKFVNGKSSRLNLSSLQKAEIEMSYSKVRIMVQPGTISISPLDIAPCDIFEINKKTKTHVYLTFTVNAPPEKIVHIFICMLESAVKIKKTLLQIFDLHTIDQNQIKIVEHDVLTQKAVLLEEERVRSHHSQSERTKTLEQIHKGIEENQRKAANAITEMENSNQSREEILKGCKELNNNQMNWIARLNECISGVKDEYFLWKKAPNAPPPPPQPQPTPSSWDSSPPKTYSYDPNNESELSKIFRQMQSQAEPLVGRLDSPGTSALPPLPTAPIPQPPSQFHSPQRSQRTPTSAFSPKSPYSPSLPLVEAPLPDVPKESLAERLTSFARNKLLASYNQSQMELLDRMTTPTMPRSAPTVESPIAAVRMRAEKSPSPGDDEYLSPRQMLKLRQSRRRSSMPSVNDLEVEIGSARSSQTLDDISVIYGDYGTMVERKSLNEDQEAGPSGVAQHFRSFKIENDAENEEIYVGDV